MLLQIAYGSETGCAEDVAQTLHRRLQYYLNPEKSQNILCSLNDLNFVSPSVLVIICSTCGQGDPPINSKLFWKKIMGRSVPSNFFEQTYFSVLGLGDSAYTKFNFVAKKLFRRIQMLRGKPLFDLVLADEQHEHGSDFQSEKFMSHCLQHLAVLLEYDLGKPLLPLDSPLPCRMDLETSEPSVEVLTTQSWRHNCQYLGRIESVTRVTTEDHFQKTILIRISFDNCSFSDSMKPGDVLAVQPKNSQLSVDLFFDLFSHISSETIIRVPAIAESAFSAEFLVRRVLDVTSIPRRSFFDLLSKLAQDEDEKEKLEEIFHDQEMFYSYCCRPRRSILEVFQDFPKTTAVLPLDRIIEVVPQIKERNFSMASVVAQIDEQRSFVELLIAAVKYQTKIKQPRMGLCSNYLADAREGEDVQIDFRKGSFTLPPGTGSPLIMIGPGTGVAPFRSFIQSRQGKNCYLFFGCRHPEKDFYFKEEWSEHFKDLKVFPAFSRYNKGKVCYVQHEICEHKQLLWNLISANAYIYLAGSSKQMPKDVKEAVIKVIEEGAGVDNEEAKAYFDKLEKARRFQEETW
ncbi:NADPH-dependent diflavin oxidoreductase 1-like [Convolutriloba macropyga]|uniref:NADPH-dependent diflavin oxidoreductase 1-like n=1 Tax=Convolutriloba macropyga TaxID=536237 RepID=UPI003F523B0F